jgi:hypothetical protein
MATILVVKLVELSGHALALTAGLLVITAIAVSAELLLCWVEKRMRNDHHIQQVLNVVRRTAYVLLFVDCLLLVACCGFSAARTMGFV